MSYNIFLSSYFFFNCRIISDEFLSIWIELFASLVTNLLKSIGPTDLLISHSMLKWYVPKDRIVLYRLSCFHEVFVFMTFILNILFVDHLVSMSRLYFSLKSSCTFFSSFWISSSFFLSSSDNKGTRSKLRFGMIFWFSIGTFFVGTILTSFFDGTFFTTFLFKFLSATSFFH